MIIDRGLLMRENTCMKRDAGVTEVIGAIILIAITVAGAGIVMSMIMTPPDRAMPTLDYYGCNPVGNTKCIVHQGGATLYAGQYYVRGLDLNHEPVPNLLWTFNGAPVTGCDELGCRDHNFTLEDRICTDNAAVSYIQLVIIDETGHSLHGTVNVDGPCISEVSVGGAGSFEEACTAAMVPNEYAGVAGVSFNPATCAWRCSDGLRPIDYGEGLSCERSHQLPNCNLFENPYGPVEGLTLNPNNCQWVCSDGFPPDRVGSTHSCDRIPPTQRFPTASVCYVRDVGQTVIRVSELSNAGQHRLQLVYASGTPATENFVLSNGDFSAIGSSGRRAITEINLINSAGVVPSDCGDNCRFTFASRGWCPCPDGMNPDPNPDGEKCITLSICPPNSSDPFENGECICDMEYVPTGTIDPEGYPVCEPNMFDLKPCLYNPTGTKVRINGSGFQEGVTYVAYNGGDSLTSPFTRLDGTRYILGPYNEKVSSLVLYDQRWLRPNTPEMILWESRSAIGFCGPNEGDCEDANAVWVGPDSDDPPCACKDGFSKNDLGICVPKPVDNLDVCWFNPDKSVIQVSGGFVGVEYKIRINGDETSPASLLTYTGSATKISVTIDSKTPINSIELLLHDENEIGKESEWGRVVKLEGWPDITYCPGTCPPNQNHVEGNEGDCECDLKEGYKPTTVRDPKEKDGYAVCDCIDGYTETVTGDVISCDLKKFMPDFCWAHENRRSVRITALVPVPPAENPNIDAYRATNVANLDYSIPLGSYGTPPRVYVLGTVLKEFLQGVITLRLYVDANDALVGESQDSSDRWCTFADCHASESCSTTELCEPGDANCPVACTNPAMFWDGGPECKCPPGYTRVEDECEPIDIEEIVSVTCDSPSAVTIDWGNAPAGATYDVVITGIKADGTEVTNPAESLTVGQQIKLPQPMKVTGVTMTLKPLAGQESGTFYILENVASCGLSGDITACFTQGDISKGEVLLRVDRGEIELFGGEEWVVTYADSSVKPFDASSEDGTIIQELRFQTVPKEKVTGVLLRQFDDESTSVTPDLCDSDLDLCVPYGAWDPETSSCEECEDGYTSTKNGEGGTCKLDLVTIEACWADVDGTWVRISGLDLKGNDPGVYWVRVNDQDPPYRPFGVYGVGSVLNHNAEVTSLKLYLSDTDTDPPGQTLVSAYCRTIACQEGIEKCAPVLCTEGPCVDVPCKPGDAGCTTPVKPCSGEANCVTKCDPLDPPCVPEPCTEGSNCVAPCDPSAEPCNDSTQCRSGDMNCTMPVTPCKPGEPGCTIPTKPCTPGESGCVDVPCQPGDMCTTPVKPCSGEPNCITRCDSGDDDCVPGQPCTEGDNCFAPCTGDGCILVSCKPGDANCTTPVKPCDPTTDSTCKTPDKPCTGENCDPVPCEPGDRNCPVACPVGTTNPSVAWNQVTQDCECPPGYTEEYIEGKMTGHCNLDTITINACLAHEDKTEVRITKLELKNPGSFYWARADDQNIDLGNSKAGDILKYNQAVSSLLLYLKGSTDTEPAGGPLSLNYCRTIACQEGIEKCAPVLCTEGPCVDVPCKPGDPGCTTPVKPCVPGDVNCTTPAKPCDPEESGCVTKCDPLDPSCVPGQPCTGGDCIVPCNPGEPDCGTVACRPGELGCVAPCDPTVEFCTSGPCKLGDVNCTTPAKPCNPAIESCIENPCAPGDKNCPVACPPGETNPSVAWNQVTQDCECPSGYDRVRPTGDCVPIDISERGVSVTCNNPSGVTIHWGTAPLGATYAVTFTGIRANGELDEQPYSNVRVGAPTTPITLRVPMKVTKVTMTLKTPDGQESEPSFEIMNEGMSCGVSGAITACFTKDSTETVVLRVSVPRMRC